MNKRSKLVSENWETYTSWRRMRHRLSNVDSYSHLDMDPRWNSFHVFLEDMGPRPTGKWLYSLERVNNKIGYWPENCKWILLIDQSKNRRLPRARKGWGIRGVRLSKNRWIVEACGKYLGSSKSLFEACCVRKSWEARNGIYR